MLHIFSHKIKYKIHLSWNSIFSLFQALFSLEETNIINLLWIDLFSHTWLSVRWEWQVLKSKLTYSFRFRCWPKCLYFLYIQYKYSQKTPNCKSCKEQRLRKYFDSCWGRVIMAYGFWDSWYNYFSHRGDWLICTENTFHVECSLSELLQSMKAIVKMDIFLDMEEYCNDKLDT